MMDEAAAILILDTAGVPFSIAIARGKRCLASVVMEDRKLLASHITICVIDVMREAGLKLHQLSAIGVNEGPGSYTGLRIGYSVAKGLCYGLGIPLLELSGHRGVAERLIDGMRQDEENTLILAAIEARQAEIYLAGFDTEMNEVRTLQAVKLPMDDEATYFEGYRRALIGGDGAVMLAETLKSTEHQVVAGMPEVRWLVTQAHNAFLAEKFSDVNKAEPLYFKPPNITTPKKK